MMWHLEILHNFPITYCGSQSNGSSKISTLLYLGPVGFTLYYCQWDFAGVLKLMGIFKIETLSLL